MPMARELETANASPMYLSSSMACASRGCSVRCGPGVGKECRGVDGGKTMSVNVVEVVDPQAAATTGSKKTAVGEDEGVKGKGRRGMYGEEKEGR